MNQYRIEVRKLKILARAFSRSHQQINHRVHQLAFEQHMIEMAHEGKVFFVESGRDCDGVEYSGYIRSCEPNLNSYYEMVDEINNWADGPFFLDLVSHEEVDNIKYSSYDRSMEAFEDGHPHIIYSSC